MISSVKCEVKHTISLSCHLIPPRCGPRDPHKQPQLAKIEATAITKTHWNDILDILRHEMCMNEHVFEDQLGK